MVRAFAPSVVNERVVRNQGVVADLVDQSLRRVAGDVVVRDVKSGVVGVDPEPGVLVVVDVVVGDGGR